MSLEVRKYVTFTEEVLREAGRPIERRNRRAVVAAVVTNPYAGTYSEGLDLLVDGGEELSAVLIELAKDVLGTEVEAYGKGGIVGTNGELEHASAVLHPKFGPPLRGAVDGVSILPSTKKRGGPGTRIDIPVHHKKAMLVRSHFDAVEFNVPDAPLPDELVIAIAVSTGGRPFERSGGLTEADAVGEDGMR